MRDHVIDSHVTDHLASFPSVVFRGEPVRFTKYDGHLVLFMAESQHGRQTAVAALMDDKEKRKRKERRTAEEPEETENCEVGDVKTLPVWVFSPLLSIDLLQFDAQMCNNLFSAPCSTV